MSTRSVIVKAEDDGTFKASFVHFDGYLEKPGVGYNLWHYYNTDARAEKLVSLGDLQSVNKYLSPSIEAKTYGWDINLDDNQTRFNLFNLPQKKINALQKNADLHTEADYRDQYAHSAYYKDRIRHPRQSVHHGVQQLSLGVEASTEKRTCTKRLWKDYKPYHAKNWDDFLEHGPNDYEYLYLFYHHQWHCLVSNELGDDDLTIADTVRTIKDRQHQMALNWKRSGKKDKASLLHQLSDIKTDLGKKLSITAMQILMSSVYQSCRQFQEKYDKLWMPLITLPLDCGYNDSAFHDGKLIDITSHRDDDEKDLPENEYQISIINSEIRNISNFNE